MKSNFIEVSGCLQLRANIFESFASIFVAILVHTTSFRHSKASTAFGFEYMQNLRNANKRLTPQLWIWYSPIFLFKTETKHPKLLSSICHYIWKYLISCSLVFAVFGIILPPHFTYLVYFIHTQTQTDWNQFFATIHGRHTTSKLL